MGGASREKDSSDYDLERFVEMFDQALTSDDPRVKNALRQLMMMVVLTDTEDHEGKQRSSHGPLRRMQQDMRDQCRWVQRLENDVESLKRQISSTNAISGYRAGPQPKEFDAMTTHAALGQSFDPKEYQAALQQGLNLTQPALQDLNIKINSGSLLKEKK